VNVFVAAISIVVVLGLAFFFVLTVTEVGQAVKRRHSGRSAGPAPDPSPPALDPAAQELRMRYARGEISREEYLQRKIDLEEY
jgi:putative membrane protein